jgi:hypothetical protein
MEIHAVVLKFGGNEADLASNLSGAFPEWSPVEDRQKLFALFQRERLIDQTIDVRRASSLSPGHQIGSPTPLPTHPLQDAH